MVSDERTVKGWRCNHVPGGQPACTHRAWATWLLGAHLQHVGSPASLRGPWSTDVTRATRAEQVTHRRSVQLDSGEQGAGCVPTLASPGSPAIRDMEPKDQQLTVALRIRPLNDTEQEEGASVIAHKVGEQMVVLMDPGEDPEDTLRTHRSREKTFIFDTVFDQHASQGDVYRATTQRLVDGIVSGYNATVFAYGPSGAGKTHTMLGMDAEPGIYLQTLADLFRAIERTRDSVDSSVSMSYLEIYNEVIRDLLNPSSGLLELREDARGSIQIAGITEVSTSNAQEIMQLLTRGNRQRTQEPTAANRTSSRSHAVLQVTVRRQGRGHHLAEGVRIGRLFLVDLAGSERASQTQNRGKRMQEGAHINRSLLALGNCINALSERGGGRTQYVNFRDSKLTRLLKDALGGNSRTVMIAHISPASTSFEESRSTLLYAHRAKSIKTRVKRNLLTMSCHLDQDMDVISDLRRQIEHLKSKIERQEHRRSEPGNPGARVAMPAQDPEEDSRLQMNETRAQLMGTFQEQPEMAHSPVELEDANIELHANVSQHLLAIADWEKPAHHTQDEAPEGDEQQAVDDAAGDEGESAEPHEGALAGAEVSLLLAAQRKTVALQVGRGRQPRRHPGRVTTLIAAPAPALALRAGKLGSAAQLEERLLCRAQELEAENAALQAGRLHGAHLLAQRDLLIGRLRQHQLLCEGIIRDQRQLIQDAGLPVPTALDERYGLYARELGGGSLGRLLLLHSATATATASSLPDGSVGNTSPPLEEAPGDQVDRKGPPGGAPFELPQMLLETDSDGFKVSKATPSKQRGRQAALAPPPLRILLTPPAHEVGVRVSGPFRAALGWGEQQGSFWKGTLFTQPPRWLSAAGDRAEDAPGPWEPLPRGPSSWDSGRKTAALGQAPVLPGGLTPLVSPQRSSALRAKPVASRLSSPAGLDFEEVAASTKSIALVAASRRCQAQDREGGSGRSSLHLPDSRDSSPAGSRRPRASPGREGSAERKARSRRSPRLSPGVRPVGGQGPRIWSQGSRRTAERAGRTRRVMVDGALGARGGDSQVPAPLPPARPPLGIKPTTGLQATEKPQPPTPARWDESQTPPASHQPSKSSSLFPAVPAASKTKPGPHAGTGPAGARGWCLCVLWTLLCFPPQTQPPSQRWSADSGGQGRSPLPPSSPRRPRGRSAKGPRRPL
ncbi:kinesin-like protein KIF19 [Myotis yumanensis]|uniref:kinesin-like protein KIF19 n=1 Tax=Myotis yumanensis TaxID=159337 RepID=UPI0038D17F95